MDDHRVSQRTDMPKTKPYSCSQCKATFTRAAHLRRHQSSHGKEKPFICAYCPLSSSRKDVIVRHSRKFHASPTTAPRTTEGRCNTNQLHRVRVLSPATSGSASVDDNPNQEEHADPHADCDWDFSFNDFAPIGDFTIMDKSIMDAEQINKQGPPPDGESEMSLPMPDQHEGRIYSEISFVEIPTYIEHSSVAVENGNGLRYLLTDENYTKAKVNFVSSFHTSKAHDILFPSKYMVSRFTRAFFEHMAPHVPIIHEPTFKIEDTAAPLLVQIMSCGALYVNEEDIATKLHDTAMALVLHDQKRTLSAHRERESRLWVFQAWLLISIFKFARTASPFDPDAISMLPYTIQLAYQVLRDVKQLSPITYHEWVYQESIFRCTAYTIVLGAVLNAVTGEQLFTLPPLDGKFALPSNTTEWQKDEENWNALLENSINYSETLDCVLNGQMPSYHLSDFGWLTVTAGIVCRICSFETLFRAENSDIYGVFISKMEQPLEVIREAWKSRSESCDHSGTAYDPLEAILYSLLNSSYYHLYASQPLKLMKRLVSSPTEPDSLTSLFEPSGSPSLIGSQKALVRAAETWRQECRIGINYLQRLAYYRFSPLASLHIYEGGLLLFWYQLTKSLGSVTVTHDFVLETLTAECVSELCIPESQAQDEALTLPLTISAKLLSGNPVWRWPSSMGSLMMQLGDQIRFASLGL